MITAQECRKAAQAFLDRLSDRLHNLPPEYENQKALARAAGVSNATPSDYKNRKRLENPAFKTVFQVAYALLGKPPCSLEEPTEADYLPIPQISGRIAAHPHGRIPDNAVESIVWLRRSQVGGRLKLVAIRLGDDADSMTPSLRPGDLIIIDRADKEITPRGLYAVRLPDLESCAIKRVQPVPEKDYVLLLSDNSAYPPEPIPWHEHLIIGRVVWSCTNWVK